MLRPQNGARQGVGPWLFDQYSAFFWIPAVQSFRFNTGFLQARASTLLPQTGPEKSRDNLRKLRRVLARIRPGP